MSRAVDPALARDMRETLLSEFGARAIYAALARDQAEPELARLAASFEAEERALIDGLRALLEGFGLRAKRRSRRREILARLLAATSSFGGRAFALRLCHAAESTLARRYHAYARHLEKLGDCPAAKRCDELGLVKERHARALEAWVRL